MITAEIYCTRQNNNRGTDRGDNCNMLRNKFELSALCFLALSQQKLASWNLWSNNGVFCMLKR